jgi:ABC-type polysaccharide/polyol phosphate transport system ATPase subunit
MSSGQGSDPIISLHGVSVGYRVPKGRQRRIDVKNLFVSLGRRRQPMVSIWALRDVDLTVASGEVLGVIGRNGAGKSTLLSVISRVLKPMAGSVVVRGRTAPLLQVGSAFDNELSGRENLYLNAAFLGFTRREVDERYNEIVDFAEVGDFMEAPFRTFSSGMGARLGFSLATSAHADILLVDEILAVGDEHFRHKCMARIDEFRRRQVTILYVSHDLPIVQQICSRVIWIDSGHIMASGEPAAVVSAYKDFVGRL